MMGVDCSFNTIFSPGFGRKVKSTNSTVAHYRVLFMKGLLRLSLGCMHATSRPFELRKA